MITNLKNIKDPHAGQFQYLDRWVNKNTFRAWVYNKDGQEKLADSYNEFQELTSSGIWFAKRIQEESVVTPKTRKPKDVVCSAS